MGNKVCTVCARQDDPFTITHNNGFEPENDKIPPV